MLVRLQEENRKIKYLTEQSRNEEVEGVEKRKNSINKSIVKAFTEYFDFCEVYFFYSDESNELKKGAYSPLFDANNNKVEKLNNEYIYIAAYTYRDFGEPYLTDYKTLVIMDNNLKQLRKPFPYYPYINPNLIKWLYPLSRKLKKLKYFERQVYLLNFNLNKYYEKTARKREKWRYKTMKRN